MLFHFYGFVHHMAKLILHKPIPGTNIQFFNVYAKKNEEVIRQAVSSSEALINGDNITSASLFYGENSVDGGHISFSDKFGFQTVKSLNSICETKYAVAWENLLNRVTVPEGWRNSGFLQTGYIHEKGQWCLSSWIWTSAATARYYSLSGQTDLCQKIADAFLREQLSCGGWIVRYEFEGGKTTKVVAPNDSAYIAHNSLISAYDITGDSTYLTAAVRCADWIIETARTDGIVFTAVDPESGEGKKDANIVDIGFTVALFADITVRIKDDRYIMFAEKFLNRYIELFFDKKENAFYTALDNKDRPVGGYFARGQAWALEGLISVYKVNSDNALSKIICRLSDYLISKQNKDGSWSYNFSKPMMGNDCKGISVIARNLLDVYELFKKDSYLFSAKRALKWCEKHTVLKGEEEGCIESYSVEGAVVHNLYTTTAFVYSTAYALETMKRLKDINDKCM